MTKAVARRLLVQQGNRAAARVAVGPIATVAMEMVAMAVMVAGTAVVMVVMVETVNRSTAMKILGLFLGVLLASSASAANLLVPGADQPLLNSDPAEVGPRAAISLPSAQSIDRYNSFLQTSDADGRRRIRNMAAALLKSEPGIAAWNRRRGNEYGGQFQGRRPLPAGLVPVPPGLSNDRCDLWTWGKYFGDGEVRPTDFASFYARNPEGFVWQLLKEKGFQYEGQNAGSDTAWSISCSRGNGAYALFRPVAEKQLVYMGDWTPPAGEKPGAFTVIPIPGWSVPQQWLSLIAGLQFVDVGRPWQAGAVVPAFTAPADFSTQLPGRRTRFVGQDGREWGVRFGPAGVGMLVEGSSGRERPITWTFDRQRGLCIKVTTSEPLAWCWPEADARTIASGPKLD